MLFEPSNIPFFLWALRPVDVRTDLRKLALVVRGIELISSLKKLWFILLVVIFQFIAKTVPFWDPIQTRGLKCRKITLSILYVTLRWSLLGEQTIKSVLKHFLRSRSPRYKCQSSLASTLGVVGWCKLKDLALDCSSKHRAFRAGWRGNQPRRFSEQSLGLQMRGFYPDRR